jgi:hypothetical protein
VDVDSVPDRAELVRFCWSDCVRPAAEEAIATGCVVDVDSCDGHGFDPSGHQAVLPDVEVVERQANNDDPTKAPGYAVRVGQRSAWVVSAEGEA